MPAGARTTPAGADAHQERGGADRSRVDGEGSSRPEPVRARIAIDGEVFTVVEGDLLLDEDQRQVYELERQVRAARHRLVASTALTDAPVTPGGAAPARSSRPQRPSRSSGGHRTWSSPSASCARPSRRRNATRRWSRT